MLRFDKLTPRAFILVVEDKKNVRDSVQQVIEEIGFRVEAAATEDEAVEFAKRHRPDLLIVDQHEPVRVDLSHRATTIASRICERAQLGSDLMMVTHPDAALIVEEPNRLPTKFSGGHGIRIWYPRGADPS